MSEIAHLGPVELLTPKGEESLRFFVDGRFVYAPDEPCVVWTEAERAKGQAWGVQTVPSFHTYGTPPVG